MTIPFKNVPSNIRVPLFYAEVDNSRANNATINQRALIVGLANDYLQGRTESLRKNVV